MDTASLSSAALSSAERRELKARAHGLDPVVRVGDKGITTELLAEVERALQAHELIKIRAAALERAEREWALNEICRRTGSHAVQTIGKVLVLFRRKPDREGDAGGGKRQAPERAAGTRGAIRSGRRESRSASIRRASAPPRRPPGTFR